MYAPTPHSDNAITSLFFISVVLAGVATAEFTALQLYHDPDEKDDMEITEALRNAAAADTPDRDMYRFLAFLGNRPLDLEKGTTLQNGKPASKLKSKVFKDMALRFVVLLYASFLTLFAGIFTFIWSNQKHVVSIPVTVFAGVLCVRPLFLLSVFCFDMINA